LVLAATFGGATASFAATSAKYDPKIDPADFGGPIDNPYLPLAPGSRWVYEETHPDYTEHIVVEVTPYTKKILGVDTVVVRDTATVDGVVTEDTADFYAQDRAGNVWYFGEATVEYAHGQPDTTLGSWEGGVAGAQPGIVMYANPKPGPAYRQEFLAGVAEDKGKIVRTDATAQVPFGSFDHAVETKDFTALEPDVVEHKFYVKGIGVVLEQAVKGGASRAELIEFTKGG
jgi:hypothetical protein